nr:hypothetical protein BaRGS_032316 [Batillaria attramentaria]
MFISVTVGLLILILTVTALTYRYRWHLRLVLYEAFRGRGDRWRRLQALSFQFDVFVSYAADDLNWVRTQLMPELEERMGLKLCIHERDFIPGYPIVDNISDSVEASKKVMMIFSKHFTRSQWCQFELCFCLNHVIKNDDALLVVCLEDLSSRDLTPAMMAVLGTTTYIQWNDDSDARRSFWGRLQIALHEVMRSPRI